MGKKLLSLYGKVPELSSKMNVLCYMGLEWHEGESTMAEFYFGVKAVFCTKIFGTCCQN